MTDQTAPADPQMVPDPKLAFPDLPAEIPFERLQDLIISLGFPRSALTME